MATSSMGTAPWRAAPLRPLPGDGGALYGLMGRMELAMEARSEVMTSLEVALATTKPWPWPPLAGASGSGVELVILMLGVTTMTRSWEEGQRGSASRYIIHLILAH